MIDLHFVVEDLDYAHTCIFNFSAWHRLWPRYCVITNVGAALCSSFALILMHIHKHLGSHACYIYPCPKALIFGVQIAL